MPYLIDGNNVLGSYRSSGSSGRDRRAEVVRRVSSLVGRRGARATIVFDGAPLREDVGDQVLGPVQLRFPGAGSDADSMIRAIVDAAERPSELTVVTSDKALGSYCRTRGAAWLRAHEWNALERQATVPAGKGRVAQTSPDKPEHETDVEGWLRRFGQSS